MRNRALWASAFLLPLVFAAAPRPGAEDSLATPDQAAYVARLTQEHLDLALADGPGERIVRLTEATDRRLRELKAVIEARRLEHAAPLANAYLRLVLEGVPALIQQGERKGLELTAELAAAERIARKHPVLLDELMLAAPVELEGLMQTAADAAKKHLANVRGSLERAKKARGDLGGPPEEERDEEAGAAGETQGGFGFDLRDLNKPGEGGGGGADDDRRKGRGD